MYLHRYKQIRGRGGIYALSWHVFAYICANTPTSVLKKNLTFPNYKFGKGKYAFHPVKLSRYAEKMILSEIPKFNEGGDPYELGQRPSHP